MHAEGEYECLDWHYFLGEIDRYGYLQHYFSEKWIGQDLMLQAHLENLTIMYVFDTLFSGDIDGPGLDVKNSYEAWHHKAMSAARS